MPRFVKMSVPGQTVATVVRPNIGLTGNHQSSLLEMPVIHQSVVARFEAKLLRLPIAGCWLWTASTFENGYGMLIVNKKSCTTHRLAWKIFKGEIPNGMCVLHKCDVRCCVNPDHLFLGTYADNNKDCKAKGRHTKGSMMGTAKLTEEQVASIRSSRNTQKQLAAQYGVSQSLISLILVGKIWKHVTLPPQRLF
jgi:hypothetical protein